MLPFTREEKRGVKAGTTRPSDETPLCNPCCPERTAVHLDVRRWLVDRQSPKPQPGRRARICSPVTDGTPISPSARPWPAHSPALNASLLVPSNSRPPPWRGTRMLCSVSWPGGSTDSRVKLDSTQAQQKIRHYILLRIQPKTDGDSVPHLIAPAPAGRDRIHEGNWRVEVWSVAMY